ncbi:MAG TPA: galactokinase family protein [Eubacteriales bacterium]|nr:galactokinase family protein [Eubacteriales bacterium]
MRDSLTGGALDGTLRSLYGDGFLLQREKYLALLDRFKREFGLCDEAALFSAPGRSEIGGNHTDHQLGRVLAAAVTMDTRAAAAPRSDNAVCIRSKGYPPLRLSLDRLDPRPGETNGSTALVRGIAERLRTDGWKIGGFDACIESDVPKGSGLSSSAAFSILICTIFSGLFNEGEIPPVEQALASKYAENVHFGKPSGLMDQLASAVGGFVAIDFADPEKPEIERVECDLAANGYAVCIVNAGGSHANLTPEYAAIPAEMGEVARRFGKQFLRQVDEAEFYAALPKLRGAVPDRALLRAMHFFAENERVPKQVRALKEGDMEAFRLLMNESGRSSFEYLQNVCPSDPNERGLALALAVSERMLKGEGAWRVHGGGFAGTIQALVPLKRVAAYSEEIERVFGAGSCYRFAVRPAGGVQLK